MKMRAIAACVAILAAPLLVNVCSVAFSQAKPTPATINGVTPIANGGTGSSTQNFVDLSTNQTAAGVKTFTNDIQSSGNVGIGMHPCGDGGIGLCVSQNTDVGICSGGGSRIHICAGDYIDDPTGDNTKTNYALYAQEEMVRDGGYAQQVYAVFGQAGMSSRNTSNATGTWTGVGGQCYQLGTGVVTKCRGVAGIATLNTGTHGGELQTGRGGEFWCSAQGGTGTIDNCEGLYVRQFGDSPGVSVNKGGLAIEEIKGGQNNIDILIDTHVPVTFPDGSYAIYSTDPNPSVLGGTLNVPTICIGPTASPSTGGCLFEGDGGSGNGRGDGVLVLQRTPPATTTTTRNPLMLIQQQSNVSTQNDALDILMEVNAQQDAGFLSYDAIAVQNGTTAANTWSYPGVLEGIFTEVTHYGSGSLNITVGVDGESLLQDGGGPITKAEGVYGLAANNSVSTMSDGRGGFFECNNIGAGSTPVCRGVVSRIRGFGGSMTSAYEIQAQNSALATGIVGKAGLVADEMTGATNNTDIFIGSGADSTIPTGNWAFYSASARNSFISGPWGFQNVATASLLTCNGTWADGTSVGEGATVMDTTSHQLKVCHMTGGGDGGFAWAFVTLTP